MNELNFFVSTFIQMFALLSPFGVAIFFASNTSHFKIKERQLTAKMAIIAITITTILIFWLGNICLNIFGVSLDAFRVGTGIIMLLNSISIVRGTKFYDFNATSPSDFAIVPYAIPYVVGPGIIGYLIVLRVQTESLFEIMTTLIALIIVIAIIAVLIWNSDRVSNIIGKRKMAVIDRLFGLIICSMAAQIILDGIKNSLLIK